MSSARLGLNPALEAAENGAVDDGLDNGRRFRRAFWGNPVTVGATMVLVLLIFMAIAAPLIAPYDPLAQEIGHQVAPPSSSHWLGTDETGRDVLSRVIWGARISLLIGAVAVTIGAAGGIVLGLAAGYYGGVVDAVLGRLIDALLSFPMILMALALMAALGTGLVNVMITVGMTIIPNVARLVRGSVLVQRDVDYLAAARALGAGNRQIIWQHVVPNILPNVIVYASLALPGAILTEASLSFLGVGVDPPTPTWGSIVRDGSEILSAAPWIATSAAIAILLTVMAVNLIGDALRDALDPRLRSMAGG